MLRHGSKQTEGEISLKNKYQCFFYTEQMYGYTDRNTEALVPNQ